MAIEVGSDEEAEVEVTAPEAEHLLELFPDAIRDVREAVNKAIEAVRATGSVGSSLQATVTLTAPPETHALLASSYTNASEFSGDTMNIRISGATAQDPGLLASTIRNCTAGSMTRYSISNTFVYFCTPDTTKVTMRAGADSRICSSSNCVSRKCPT